MIPDETIKRVESITKNVNAIVNQEILTLPYFNGKNLNKNYPTFRRVLLEECIKYGDEPFSLGLYNSYDNTLYLSQHCIDAWLLCHEMVHMLSADIERKIVGYADNHNLVAFNEAATDWLVSRCFNINSLKGSIYPEITKVFDTLVKRYGEEKMYNGFFEANFQKFYTSLSTEEKQDIDLTITEMNELNLTKEFNQEQPKTR
jgi:hypothetical protein